MLNLKTICMFLSAVFSVAFPVALLIVWKKKTGAKLLPFFVGAAVFFLFAIVLESLFKSLMQKNAVVSEYLTKNVLVAAIYGGMTAGIFEETGRYLAFKTVLRRHNKKNTSVTYGIGHGGLEMLLLLGQTYVLLLLALMTNGKGALSVYLPTAESLTVGFIGFAALERISAMALHIGLSVFVYYAVWDEKKLWLYPLAIWLHAMADAIAVFYQKGMLSLWQTELCILAFAALVLFCAIRLYRKRRKAPVRES